MGARQSAEMRKALRLLQKDASMSQAEAARQAGISRSALTKHFQKQKAQVNYALDAKNHGEMK
jgi:DNA-binding Lrp family transcriptional regulator